MKETVGYTFLLNIMIIFTITTLTVKRVLFLNIIVKKFTAKVRNFGVEFN